MPKPDSQPKICDYEGSNYRTEFWEGKGRDYEDRVERIALRRLLPEIGQRLLEVGAGFGRLTHEYHAYQQVVLLDYSFSQLQFAREQLGAPDRYIFVAADAYKLPFRPGTFDGVTMIRVIHHMANVPAALQQIRHILVPEGTFILEFANKQNLKAILRYAMGQQDWSPYELDPVEFVELNFDFHPEYILKELKSAGFSPTKRIPVSFFRLKSLKNSLPTGLLVTLDSALQLTGMLYAPSIFTRCEATGSGSDNNLDIGDNIDSLFVCPESGGELQREGNTLISVTTGSRWAFRDGIYDFKAPLD